MNMLRGRFGWHRNTPEPEPALPDEPVAADPPPSPVGQDERRMQVRAYNHWAGLLGERNFPAIRDLDPAALPDFGPHSVLLDFSAGIDNPAVTYIGPALAAECGAHGPIARLGDVPSLSLLSRITDHYMQILANQAPIGFEAEFVNGVGATVLYRGILLPYSSNNETIDFIFGVINWKELASPQVADELLLEIGEALRADAASDGPVLRPRAADPVADLPQPPPPAPTGIGADPLPSPAFGLESGPSGGPAAATDDEGGEEWAEDEEDEAADVLDLETWSIEGDAVFAQPVWADEALSAEDYEEGEDEGEDDHLPSLMRISIDRADRPRKPAALLLDDALPGGDAEHGEPVAEMADDAADAFAHPQVPAGMQPGPRALSVAEPMFGDAGGTDHDTGAWDDEPRAAHPIAASLEAIAAAMEAEYETATDLGDCLAAAREMAQAAAGSEDRSRGALYEAVSRAYDVSIAAAAEPEAFAELLADSGITAQARAPMVPVVKLVFGAGYDKTRVTEYATVLAYAHETGVPRGALGRHLGTADGGLKGIVKAERERRRRERGAPEAPPPTLRPAALENLRALPVAPLGALPPQGEEFALVLVRRLPDGTLALVGELPPEPAQLERAGRVLAGLRDAGDAGCDSGADAAPEAIMAPGG